MIINSSKHEEIIWQDIQIGEVWLAGGQSNMEFYLKYDLDADEEKKNSDDNIRFFDYPEVSYVGQINDAPYNNKYGFWRKAVPSDLDYFSAVGYYFTKQLQQELKIPIGIIGCNWGGTSITAWMSNEMIIAGGGKPYLDDYSEATRNLDLTDYDKRFFSDRSAFLTDILNDPVSKAFMLSTTYQEAFDRLRNLGIKDPESASAYTLPIGPRSPLRPSGLYESMLLPLAPYGIRGVIWYQGETDGDLHPECYKTLFPAMIKEWRSIWNEDLPFLFVQLAPFERWMSVSGKNYGIIRKAQKYTESQVPNTFMAVSSDAGQRNDIHPKRKKVIGRRLALLALKHIYHKEDLLAEAPILSQIRVSDGIVYLYFKNAGTGLYLSTKTIYGESVPPGFFSGLSVIQNDQEIPADEYQTRTYCDYVTLSSPLFHAKSKIQIIIGRDPWYTVNLYNSNHIPACPADITMDRNS